MAIVQDQQRPLLASQPNKDIIINGINKVNGVNHLDVKLFGHINAYNYNVEQRGVYIYEEDTLYKKYENITFSSPNNKNAGLYFGLSTSDHVSHYELRGTFYDGRYTWLKLLTLHNTLYDNDYPFQSSLGTWVIRVEKQDIINLEPCRGNYTNKFSLSSDNPNITITSGGSFPSSGSIISTLPDVYVIYTNGTEECINEKESGTEDIDKRYYVANTYVKKGDRIGKPYQRGPLKKYPVEYKSSYNNPNDEYYKYEPISSKYRLNTNSINILFREFKEFLGLPSYLTNQDDYSTHSFSSEAPFINLKKRRFPYDAPNYYNEFLYNSKPWFYTTFSDYYNNFPSVFDSVYRVYPSLDYVEGYEVSQHPYDPWDEDNQGTPHIDLIKHPDYDTFVW